MIFDYLLPTHKPDKAFETELNKPERDEMKLRAHPLDFVAATCESLRDEVNEWALHCLVRWQGVTK